MAISGTYSKLEVPTILLFRPKFQGISLQNMAKHMVLTYLHFRIHMVGGLEHLDYFSHHIGNVIIPTLTHSIIFQRGRAQPPTRYIIQPDISYHKSAISIPLNPHFPMVSYGYSLSSSLGDLQDPPLMEPVFRSPEIHPSSQVMVNTSMWPCSLPASERPRWIDVFHGIN